MTVITAARWSPTGPRSRPGSSAPAARSASRPSRSTPTRTPACRTSARPTPPSGCPATPRPRPTSTSTPCWPRRRRRAPTRSTPATASSPRTPRSRGPSRRAGLTWVGPTPESIDSMGSKIGAKELMRAAGVPVLEAPAEPTEADLPLLVKASAGGGGRGMRIVRALADLPGEIATAEAEAASAFGDGTVFVEPYVERGRHVEVQVVGDGTACSSRRAGLLGAAPAPEGRRGGARARALRRGPGRAARGRPRPRRRRSTTAAPAPSSSSTTRPPSGSSSWR